MRAAASSGLDWSPVLTIMVPIFATAALGLFVWSVQRIIRRIDAIGDQIVAIGTRVTVIETKQDMAVETAARTDKVTRKTATKVGVRLPRELTDTIDPRRTRAVQ